MSKIISHQGSIVNIEPHGITVKIAVTSACAACHAKSICGAADTKDRLITIIDNQYQIYHVGETVEVLISKETSFQALFLGYILPLIILILSLFTVSSIYQNELVAGLITLGSIGVYYFLLYLFRDKIAKKFTFQIRKIES